MLYTIISYNAEKNIAAGIEASRYNPYGRSASGLIVDLQSDVPLAVGRTYSFNPVCKYDKTLNITVRGILDDRSAKSY